MEKKTYKKPRTKKVFLAIEQLMLVASPGVGGGYNPHKPIDSKRADFFDDEEAEAIEPQGYNSVWDH
mgnify:FL=1